ncbi:hypothetical protein ABZW18_08735 [Streptomyces sp. NPDC004647]|uniref:hypothetical protein n=1 Tax=Streptomyces sp. NPDC004647 TaxID=3154671 RepID=UPI0033BB45CC
MRGWRSVGVCAALLALAACQQHQGFAGPGSPAGESRSPSPSGYGAAFLAQGECGTRAARDRTDFLEVSCSSEKAVARVLARHGERPTAGPRCPPRTDFVLHISENRPDVDEDGDGAVRQGYACMRNLEEPHPGDPGGGGGPRTVVGDCVASLDESAGSRRGRVRETACDGSGREEPRFRVTAAVRTRAQCPPATALYVQLGGGTPVGCARRV